MEYLQQYWLPYTISNVVAILLLLAAWKLPRLARLLFVLLFGWAFWMNTKTALQHPEFYLDYADMALPFYASFIRGWFSEHIQPIIITIACGQLLIAVGMALNGIWVKTSCIGAIIFLLAIAPLGVGSAFPFSIFVSIAAYFIYRRVPHDFLWRKTAHG